MACIFLAAAPVCAQTPANDNFADAEAISGVSGSVAGSNIGATPEPGEKTILGFGTSSIWYVWTAPADGDYTFDTEGSTGGGPGGFMDTLLGVYTGDAVDNLTVVAENDDINYPTDPASRVTFTASAGTVYYIAVDSYGGVSGQYRAQLETCL